MLKKLSNKANNVKEQVLAKDLEEHSRYNIDVLLILYTRVLKTETNGVISTWHRTVNHVPLRIDVICIFSLFIDLKYVKG